MRANRGQNCEQQRKAETNEEAAANKKATTITTKIKSFVTHFDRQCMLMSHVCLYLQDPTTINDEEWTGRLIQFTVIIFHYELGEIIRI